MFINPASHMGNLHCLSDAKTRSISAENPTGEKGKGGMCAEIDARHPSRDLGIGWKVRPFVKIQAGETFKMCSIEGPGAIQQMWFTPTGNWRYAILRIYWDDQNYPSVECPLGDFFCCGWGEYTQINSLPVCVNPGSAFNSYWTMPFRKKCRMTVENIAEEEMVLFYQINYTLGELPEGIAYFHAQFRRVNPLPYKEVYTIVDGISGQGHYVGTYMAWGVNNNQWWGEGEIKFYMDDDEEFPTICGTGAEDYFCGSYGFLDPKTQRYKTYSTAYAGFSQALVPDGQFLANTRFGLYRWHITDPVRFEKNLKVTIQALGWRDKGRYLPLMDDIASVAFWYQTIPASPFPRLPGKDALEII